MLRRIPLSLLEYIMEPLIEASDARGEARGQALGEARGEARAEQRFQEWREQQVAQGAVFFPDDEEPASNDPNRQ